MAQLMPLPLTISCSSKIQIGFTFVVLAHLGSPEQRAVKRVCVCVIPGSSWSNVHKTIVIQTVSSTVPKFIQPVRLKVDGCWIKWIIRKISKTKHKDISALMAYVSNPHQNICLECLPKANKYSQVFTRKTLLNEKYCCYCDYYKYTVISSGAYRPTIHSFSQHMASISNCWWMRQMESCCRQGLTITVIY